MKNKMNESAVVQALFYGMIGVFVLVLVIGIVTGPRETYTPAKTDQQKIREAAQPIVDFCRSNPDKC